MARILQAHVTTRNQNRMIDPRALRLSDLRGAVRVRINAPGGIAARGEGRHAAISRPDLGIRSAASERTSGITGLVYRSIRGVTGLTSAGLNAVLARQHVGYERTSVEREAVIAALNGGLGDHLATTGNPLAIPMRLHHAGMPLTLQMDALSQSIPDAGPRLLVLVHGLCMNDLQWTRDGHDHGRMLAETLGYTPLYLHYNTGLSIAANGQRFAEHLQQLAETWPTPVEEIVLIGHSMGGLLARSACHHAAMHGHAWPATLRHLVCMGSPHHGAPLERGGDWIDLVIGATPFAAPLARIGKIRSAGITDLRHGHALSARDRRRAVMLPKGVRCYAMAATTGRRRGDLKDRLIGDGLVPVASALGHHPDSQREVGFAKTRQWIGYGMNHLDLLSHRDVADQLLRWLKPRAPRKV